MYANILTCRFLFIAKSNVQYIHMMIESNKMSFKEYAMIRFISPRESIVLQTEKENKI